MNMEVKMKQKPIEKTIDKILNILCIACEIGMIDVCILPWIGMAINDNEISRIVIRIGLAGAVLIVITMYLGLILTMIEDKKKNK